MRGRLSSGVSKDQVRGDAHTGWCELAGFCFRCGIRPTRQDLPADRATRWLSLATNIAAWIVVVGLLFATAYGVSRLYVAAAGVTAGEVTAPTKASTFSLQISGDLNKSRR